MKKLSYAFYLAIVVFVLSEIALRFIHMHDTYAEGVGDSYRTMYGITNSTIYHLHLPNLVYTPPNNDFSYGYATNSFGVREKNYPTNKPDSTILIFTAGDSFSEGMGAPYDSTWPHLLQSYLQADSLRAEVFNTGVAGNDPVYDYVFYRDSLRQFNPDYIIVPLNASDFTDYIIRGGFERINKDGSETFRKAPWYETLYKYSRWCRVAVHSTEKFPYKGVFATEEELLENIDNTMKNFESVIDSFVEIGKANNTKIIVLLYSTPSEIYWNNNINRKMETAFRLFENESKEKNIAVVNIWTEMIDKFKGKEISQYTYENDKHYNANGYNYMALIIAKKMKEQKLLQK